jgi:hypothetical protein
LSPPNPSGANGREQEATPEADELRRERELLVQTARRRDPQAPGVLHPAVDRRAVATAEVRGPRLTHADMLSCARLSA